MTDELIDQGVDPDTLERRQLTKHLERQISRGEVVRGINLLAECGIFGMFRSSVMTGRGMFGQVDPELTTEQVLDEWIGALKTGKQEATKLMWNDQPKIDQVLQVAEGGLCSKILMAYWEVQNETPWEITENHISDRQWHLHQKDFPSGETCDYIYNKINHTEIESSQIRG